MARSTWLEVHIFFIFVPELMTRYWGSTVKMWAM